MAYNQNSSNSNCISVDNMSCSTQILIIIELNVISSSIQSLLLYSLFSTPHSTLITRGPDFRALV